MRHYEVLLLINPDQTGQIPAMLERYSSVIEKNGGTIHRQEDWGKLQLAYPINKLYKAHYILLNIECLPATMIELTNTFKFNDAVIRSLVTKCEQALKEQSVFLRNKENEKNNKDSNQYNPAGSYNNSSSSLESETKFERGEVGTGSELSINESENI